MLLLRLLVSVVQLSKNWLGNDQTSFSLSLSLRLTIHPLDSETVFLILSPCLVTNLLNPEILQISACPTKKLSISSSTDKSSANAASRSHFRSVPRNLVCLLIEGLHFTRQILRSLPSLHQASRSTLPTSRSDKPSSSRLSKLLSSLHFAFHSRT